MKNNNAAVAAIRFALDNRHEDPMTFLDLWFEGEFGRIKKEWENVPEEVFIGADTFAAPPPAQEDEPFGYHVSGWRGKRTQVLIPCETRQEAQERAAKLKDSVITPLYIRPQS